MTIEKDGWIQVIEWCEYCEVEYVGHQCAPCPLCPLRVEHSRTIDEVCLHEPYRIVSDGNEYTAQRNINNMVAEGWALVHFKVGYSEDQNERTGDSHYIALFGRKNYNPLLHREAVEAEKQAAQLHRGKRREVDAERQAYLLDRARLLDRAMEA